MELTLSLELHHELSRMWMSMGRLLKIHLCDNGNKEDIRRAQTVSDLLSIKFLWKALKAEIRKISENGRQNGSLHSPCRPVDSHTEAWRCQRADSEFSSMAVAGDRSDRAGTGSERGRVSSWPATNITWTRDLHVLISSIKVNSLALDYRTGSIRG